MSSKERFLYFAIVFFGVYYLVNMYSSNEEAYIDEYNSKIEALNDKINSLHDINKDLTSEIDVLTNKISVLDQEISKQDSKIVILKNQTNEKVNNVDSYRDDELEQFFTERYRQYLDSIKKTNSSSSN
jgi:peptidoglycan hydrolase CwlO-like protein|tara:strand:+ start:184 stop:567 length:384 start_codon:yes stop_codon:yes gene_type:complete